MDHCSIRVYLCIFQKSRYSLFKNAIYHNDEIHYAKIIPTQLANI